MQSYLRMVSGANLSLNKEYLSNRISFLNIHEKNQAAVFFCFVLFFNICDCLMLVELE